MILYLLRRSTQTIGFIVFAWLAIYTVLVYAMPDGPKAQYDMAVRHENAIAEALASGNLEQPELPAATLLVQQMKMDSTKFDRAYGVGRPWPLSFLVWLFDPGEITQLDAIDNIVPKGIDASIGNIRFQGSGMLTGDFGTALPHNGMSIGREQDVGELLATRWGNSLTLVSTSFVISLFFTLLIGLIAARRQRSTIDHALTFGSFAGFSLPPFVLGLLLIVIFAVIPYQLRFMQGWDWLPYLPSGFVSDTGASDIFANRIYHLVLPVATLALPQIALLSRQLRAAMLEVSNQDYIRTAKAKGVSNWAILIKHTFRNALIPLITVVALQLPVFISGAVMVETVFGYTGLGQVYFLALGGCLVTGPASQVLCPNNQALRPLDTSVALTLTIVIIVVVAVTNLIADLLYIKADPRIKL